MAFSSARTTSPTPRASAPPDPPSPSTTTTIGVARRLMTWMLAAIASSIQVMSRLATPIVVVVLGEGGSGGALALGVGDVVLALENAIYSVISPEGCAAILWRSASEAERAAVAMKLAGPDLLETGVA